MYDSAMKQLQLIMQKKGPSASDEVVQNQVKWLGEVGRTLLVANQLENARNVGGPAGRDATIPPPAPEQPDPPRKPVIWRKRKKIKEGFYFTSFFSL